MLASFKWTLQERKDCFLCTIIPDNWELSPNSWIKDELANQQHTLNRACSDLFSTMHKKLILKAYRTVSDKSDRKSAPYYS